VACWLTGLSVLVGTANAFLIERTQFRGKQSLLLMVASSLLALTMMRGSDKSAEHP
jgi:spermidine/putrescine transport system permease protein